jgi:hypothetical protein
MKPIPPEENDLHLRELLKQWPEAGSLPPRFQERVWKRIALAEASAPTGSGWTQWLGWIRAFAARPALAAAYVALLLSMGFSLGWVHGTARSARIDERLSSRYVQVMDPYQSVPR